MQHLNQFIVTGLLAAAGKSHALLSPEKTPGVKAADVCSDGSRFMAGDRYYDFSGQNGTIALSNDTTPCEASEYYFNSNPFNGFSPVIPGDGTPESALPIQFSDDIDPEQKASFLNACNELLPITGRLCVEQAEGDKGTPYAIVNITDNIGDAGRSFDCDFDGFANNVNEDCDNTVAEYCQYTFNITESSHVRFSGRDGAFDFAPAAVLCTLGFKPRDPVELTEKLHQPDHGKYFQAPPEGMTVIMEGTNTTAYTDFDKANVCLSVQGNRFATSPNNTQAIDCAAKFAPTVTCDYSKGISSDGAFIGDAYCTAPMPGQGEEQPGNAPSESESKESSDMNLVILITVAAALVGVAAVGFAVAKEAYLINKSNRSTAGDNSEREPGQFEMGILGGRSSSGRPGYGSTDGAADQPSGPSMTMMI